MSDCFPPCPTCRSLPEAFIFHEDCFWLTKQRLPTLSLPSIWDVGSWSSKGAEPCYQPRAPWCFPNAATRSVHGHGLVQSCVGVILGYANGRRAALGECRVGISNSIRIIAPTILHLKPANEQRLHSDAWFTSSKDEAEMR